MQNDFSSKVDSVSLGPTQQTLISKVNNYAKKKEERIVQFLFSLSFNVSESAKKSIFSFRFLFQSWFLLDVIGTLIILHFSSLIVNFLWKNSIWKFSFWFCFSLVKNRKILPVRGIWRLKEMIYSDMYFRSVVLLCKWTVNNWIV